MFSTKRNILQTTALLKEYGIKHIILSPGSRNAPLIQTFTQDRFFECQIIVDERNAAFYALGICQNKQEPVAICCTSGTALLNYGPAIAEAFYQKLPLIVLSADRSQEWIGQMDGQTIPQQNLFQNITKKSVQLPEIQNTQDEWFCNRLINEALIACTNEENGPVHINIPLAEPLFDYSQTNLPEVRKINKCTVLKTVNTKSFVEEWNRAKKKLILVGQLLPENQLSPILESLAQKSDCAILTENLANLSFNNQIANFDTILTTFGNKEEINQLSPDLIITFGGHIISKHIKQFLRKNRPLNHWHINLSGEVVDLFQSLTNIVESDVATFLEDLRSKTEETAEKVYQDLWLSYSNKIREPKETIEFSNIYAVGQIQNQLSSNASLHLANSSAIRLSQLYKTGKATKVYCNRGTNGIESSLPTALGYASVCDETVYLIIGDMSFFYTVNSLWNVSHINNLRIILLNNHGGGIFYLLKGLNKSESLEQFVAAEHQTDAEKWAKAGDFDYMQAKNKSELEIALNKLSDAKLNKSVILEVITETQINTETLHKYYKELRDKLKLNINQ